MSAAAHLRARILAVSVTLLSANSLFNASFAAADQSAPSGTMLIPLEPRLDDSTNSAPGLATVVKKAPPAPARTVFAPPVGPLAAPKVADSGLVVGAAPKKQKASAAPARSSGRQIASKVPASAPVAAPKPASSAVSEDTDVGKLIPSLAPIDEPAKSDATGTAPAAPNMAEDAGVPSDAMIDDASLLKGTVQIVADDTEYDQEKNTFLGTGNAVAIIAGQNSKLEADTILYDQNSQMIDARGNVRITRDGQLTTGSSFKFNMASDEYLITNPDTELQGTAVVARKAIGNRDGIRFQKGEFTLPQVFQIANTSNAGPLSAQERVMESKQHPDAYVPTKQSFVFSARKMVYEKYKEDGNLTVYGGKMKFDHFTLPLPKFTANASSNSRVVFPVTPIISNNLNVGGINLGPQFNYGVGRNGVFSWAPLVQLGGRSVYDSSGAKANNGKIGAGARISYAGDRLQAHLAYGSVSNLVVGDLKYRWNKQTSFQSGINRFLSDGLFGMRRARLAAEMVDVRSITKIPYIAVLQFRQSGGMFQDQPQLVSLQGSQYSNLFNTQGKTTTKAGFRLEEQITAITHPIFSFGNQKYGAQGNLFGGAALRGYSTGDTMLMGQFGPMLTVRADRLRLQGGYTQSGVSGKSPFVFDQFIQGSSSCYLGSDLRISRWLTLGTNLGYNMTNKMLYSRAFTVALGPDDCKVLLSRDTISGINRMGFQVVYGQPVKFDKLVMKGAADAGQTGGN